MVGFKGNRGRPSRTKTKDIGASHLISAQFFKALDPKLKREHWSVSAKLQINYGN